MERIDQNELATLLGGLLGKDVDGVLSKILQQKAKQEEDFQSTQSFKPIQDGQQVVVLGMHRSGTSVLTGLLSKMGLFVGHQDDLIQPADDNEKGYFERKDVVHLNALLLQTQGVTWKTHCSHFDPSQFVEKEWNRVAARMGPILSQLQENRPWVVKDPRMCLTFPLVPQTLVWRKLIENPAVILMHRAPHEVAFSLSKRNSLSWEEGLALWEHYSLAALRYSLGLPRISLTYEEVLSNPQGVCLSICEKLRPYGLKLVLPSLTDISSFVDSSLNHAGKTSHNLESIPAPIWELWEALKSGRCLEWTADQIPLPSMKCPS